MIASLPAIFIAGMMYHKFSGTRYAATKSTISPRLATKYRDYKEAWKLLGAMQECDVVRDKSDQATLD